jgi:two-component system, NarL family, sensor histidine kinase DevS
MASSHRPARNAGPGRARGVRGERDRIAAGLQHEVIRRVFAIGLDLQNVAAIATDTLIHRQVCLAVDGLDQVIRIVRDTVFALENQPDGRRLRAAVVHLCEEFSPDPDITFHGPVDNTLDPAATAMLFDLLDNALALIRRHWAPVLIDVTAAGGALVTTLQVQPAADVAGAEEPDRAFPGLRDRAARAGVRVDIKPGPRRAEISWHCCAVPAQPGSPALPKSA